MTTCTDTIHPTWARVLRTALWSLFLLGCWSTVSTPAAGAATDFVVLGEEGIWVREGSTVVSGDVGANVASAGPWLASDQEVTFGINVIVQDPTSRVMGDTMRLKSGVQVHDVFVNTLKGPGLIQGTLTTPVTLPLVAALPPVPPVTPGTQDFDVASGGTLSLDAGNYGLLKARNGAVVTLTGGIYHFQAWDLRATAQVLAAAPVDIRVQDHLETRDHVVVGPAPTAPTLTAADVVIVGTGINGTTGAIDATPEAVRIGTDSTIRANIYAPNGLLRIRDNGSATGTFVGKWVRMGNGGTITLEGGFGLGTGGGNTPPVADAGPDQTVQVTDTVQLDGSGSTDVDGDLLTFSWTLLSQPAGSTASLDDSTSVMPTFVADAAGSYEVELVVNDGAVDSAPDTVTITTINSPPVAEAGPAQTVFVTQTVLLDGANSSDVDQDPLTFLWSFVSVPSGSTATLSDPTSPTPDFTVDVPGIYEAQLTVNDGTEDSAADSVVIDTQNSKPVAIAEPDQTVPIGTTVQLDGSNSNDVDGDPLTYLWALLAMPTGSTATLSDVTLVNPTFVADVPGIYVAQLIVNDGNEDSDPATVTIMTANTPPVADAGPDQANVPVGTLVQLDGSASSDVEGTPLTFLWAITTQPAGSIASLPDATLVNPTFLVDVPGSYVVTLVVNDGTDDSTPDTVVVSTENLLPIADAGLDQTVAVGATVQLDGSASTDPEAQSLTFQWTLASTPSGSAVTVTNPTSVSPTFVADVAGTYVVQLIVDDGLAASAPDTVTVTAMINDPPVANAGPDQRTLADTTVVFNGSGSSDPDNNPLTYQWTLLQQPAGSTAAISEATTLSPVLVPDVDGSYIVQLVVNDGFVTSVPDTITVTVGNTPPVLNAIGNHTIPLGQTLTFSVSGSDPDGEATVLSATPLPLPANFVFDGLTGTVTFQPEATQVGNHVLTFAISDLFVSTTETTTVTVQAPAPGSVTGLSGRLLDTNDFTNGGIETPIVGATVSLLDTGGSVTSDAQGFFTLSGVPSGTQVLDIDASSATPGPGGATYASFRERIELIPNATKVVDRPFFLPRNDPNSVMTVNGLPVTGVDPNETTIITNPTISATLTVPPHTALFNGLEYTGPLSISEVPDAVAPAAIPPNMRPALVVTIQPPGVVFTQPLALDLENREGLPINNEMNLWSLDPAAGAFEVVGRGSIGTSTINTISGGVRAADWHWFLWLFPGFGNGGSGPEGGGNKDCNSQTGSETSVCTGGLTVQHTLDSYRSLNVDRALQLTYRSQQADPLLIFDETLEIPRVSPIPPQVSVKLAVGVEPLPILRGITLPTDPGFAGSGVQLTREIVTDTSSLSETGRHSVRLRVPWSVRDLPTGRYPTQVDLTSQFPQSSMGMGIYNTALVNNQGTSPFGAGWTLTGVDRLHVQTNGDVVLAQGDGGTHLFRQAQPGNLILNDTLTFSNTFGFNPQQVLVADFTNDGLNDIGIPRSQGLSGQFEVHQGDGTGAYQFVAVSPVGNQIREVRAVDFDEDGHLDVVANSTAGTGPVTVVYGDGAGSFSNPLTFIRTGEAPFALDVGDFNNDGHQDLVTGRGVSNIIVVQLGTGIRGAAGFGPDLVSASLTATPTDLAAADVDQDGNLDVVVANNSSIAVFYGDGTGGFAPPQVLGGIRLATKLVVADMTGDGYPDVALPEGDPLFGDPGDELFIFENSQQGGFWGPVSYPVPAGINPQSIAAGDLTGDGATDVLIGGPGIGGAMALVRGDGFGGFGTPVITVTATFNPQALTIADLDGNGTLDVAASVQGFAGNSTTNVQLFRNPSAGDGLISPVGEFSTMTANLDSTFTQRLKTGTVIQFDAQGLQTSVTDRNGNATLYAYDAQGRLETITDPVGLVTTLAYAGAVVDTITDHLGRVTQFQHDGQGNLTTITDPDLTTRTFTYNSHHLMNSQVSKRGFRTQYVFNAFGQMVQAIRPDGSTRGIIPERSLGVVDPTGTVGTATNPLPVLLDADAVATTIDGKGQMTTLALDSFGAASTVTDALNRTTTIARNEASLPTSITTPNGAIAEMTYDTQGNLLTKREAKSVFGVDRTMKFEYDPLFSQLTKITDGDNKVTTMVLDANGNPERVINPLLDERVRTFRSDGLVETDRDENLVLTVFTYDAKGNVETITDPETHVTRFVRDAAGNVTSLIEGEGTPEQRTRIFTYDVMNRLETATDGTPNPPTQFRYDDQGNLDETELPTGEMEGRTYDPMNRVASIDDPLRGLTTFTYDANGNLERTVNAAGDPTAFVYDEENQLKTITDALNGVQAFLYDVEGNVEIFTDARGKTTTFEYDKLNRQTKRIAHGGTFTTTFTYDRRDNLKNTTDPKGQLLSRVYDNNSRLTSITTPDNAITIGYDDVGNPTEVTDNDSQVTFTYDGVNRVETAETSQTSGLQPNVLLTSMYDAVGNRTQLDEDTGTSVTNFVYDLAGRLTTLTPPAGVSTQVTLGYDPSGRLASLVYPNGVTTAYGYDTKGRLDSLSHTLGANPSFASFGYTYNPVGNIQDILDQVTPTENRSHTYDALQRLKAGGAVANAETYDYDLVGNRTTSFLSSNHNHDDLNRLLEDDQFTYTYDNNGNLETKTDKVTSDLTTNHWDAQDQLVQIDRPDTTTVTYKYDGLGRRIEKDVAGTMTRYVYDGEDILLEYDGTNTFVARYSHGDQVDQPLVLQKAGQGFFYYHSNHQGSITHLTDSNGMIANSYVYDSYGRRLTVAESVIQPYSYTGREYDGESGLYFYRARYFDASTGRFLSEDPIRFRAGDQNLYRYVFNNPVNFNDPLGLRGAFAGIGGGFGSALGGGIGAGIGATFGAGVGTGLGAAAGASIGGALGIVGGPAGIAAGTVLGGALGATAGRIGGGLVGGLVGSGIGSAIGSLFDPPGSGELNFEEKVPCTSCPCP